ncbi:MAG: bifunctional folylpolyglutamate synthase/dihydrofolate synthase [Methanobacteriota archaeon]|nr:MAG: bifunctional folylpolyglutamate synthase/dihydrofolate synthase [Euryarchaeota archaeon]
MSGGGGVGYLLGLEKFGIRLGLENITELLDRLGNPQSEWKAIHVAGTNGKGSVCAFVSSVLQHAGFKVGMYTSPHLVRLNERIQVNGESISDERLEELAVQVRAVAEDMVSSSSEKQVTFFEFLTALALSHFRDQQVDFAVLEVGMGGRLDATNVVVPEVCAITHLAVEHVEHLGTTIDQIAREKAGIIKDRVPVVVSDHMVPSSILEICDKTRSGPIVIGKDIPYEREGFGLDGQRILLKVEPEQEIEIALLGAHQARNAATAYGMMEILREKGYEIPDSAIAKGFSETTWPGRFQIAMRNPFVVLDVAHNPDAAIELRKTIMEVFGREESTFVLGMLDDKDSKGFVHEIASIAERVYATSPKSPRALPASRIAEHMREYSVDVEEQPDVAEAVSKAISSSTSNEVICVTGSNTTVGEAIQYLETVKQ